MTYKITPGSSSPEGDERKPGEYVYKTTCSNGCCQIFLTLRGANQQEAFSVVTQFVTDLRRPLSQERLEKYRPAGGGDLEMLTNYFWNINLAEALIPCMHIVEIALRNTLHTTLSDHFSNDMWFYEDQVWKPINFGISPMLLPRLQKAQALVGRIVAELSFGFWVSLLNAPYEQRIWQPNSYDLLFTAFPNASGWSRKQISDRFTAIKDLRNRTFHYEPIWYRPNLRQEHSGTHQAVEWISPALHSTMQIVDNFQSALDGKAGVETKLRRHFGIL